MAEENKLYREYFIPQDNEEIKEEKNYKKLPKEEDIVKEQALKYKKELDEAQNEVDAKNKELQIRKDEFDKWYMEFEKNPNGNAGNSRWHNFLLSILIIVVILGITGLLFLVYNGKFQSILAPIFNPNISNQVNNQYDFAPKTDNAYNNQFYNNATVNVIIEKLEVNCDSGGCTGGNSSG